MHVYTVNPAKLRLKPGSLQKAFELREFGFNEDGLLVVKLLKSGSNATKKEAARETMFTELSDGKLIAITSPPSVD